MDLYNRFLVRYMYIAHFESPNRTWWVITGDEHTNVYARPSLNGAWWLNTYVS